MKITKIIILTSLLLIFSRNIAHCSQNTLNELNNTKDTIISTSLSGVFTMLGVIIGFVGIYINNNLSYKNSKKEAIYKILLEKYKEISEIYDKYLNLETSIKYTNFENIIERDITKSEYYSELFNGFINDVNEIVQLQDKAMKFVKNNAVMLHKNLKINLKKEWNNMFCLDIFGFCAELQSKQYNHDKIIQEEKDFISNIQKTEMSIFNIKTAIEEKLF